MIFRDIQPPDQKNNKTPVRADFNKKIPAQAKNPQTEKTAQIKQKISPKKSFPIIVPENEETFFSKRIAEIMYVAFGALLILLVFNLINLGNSGLKFKKNIVEAASQGFENILNGASAIQSADFDNAKALFIQAEETFQNIKNQAWFVSPDLPYVNLSDPVFDSAQALISAGKYLSLAGEKFTTAASNLQFLPKKFFEANENPSITKPSLTENIKKELPGIFEASENLAKAENEIKKIPSSFVPASLRDRFEFAKNALAVLVDFLGKMEADLPAALSLLGDNEPHTFLVLLQNNAELRPTGGFIGNLAILETNDGYLTKNEVFDVYNFDHQLAEQIPAPPEILPVNKNWFLRDSNYSGHFPLSAEKAAWFLEKENGPGVDTVIAIDQTFIKELLRITGPVQIPELIQPLNYYNFSELISYIVEAKISGRENPKSILKSFMPAVQKILLKRVDPAVLASFLRSQIEEKHILAYSKDKAVQDFFVMRGMAGEMKNLEPKEDYLNIVHTSVSGNKSDSYISEAIIHDTYLNSDGSVSDELSITRKHNWNSETDKTIKSIISYFGFSQPTQRMLEILGRSRNIEMLRIYVPSGTVLEKSSDPSAAVHSDDETGKTYFSATMNTQVGESSSLKIRYRLPFTLRLDPVDKYAITIQKQAGQNNVTLQKRIFPDSRVLNYKYFPENGSFDIDGVLEFEMELKKDEVFSSIWGK